MKRRELFKPCELFITSIPEKSMLTQSFLKDYKVIKIMSREIKVMQIIHYVNDVRHLRLYLSLIKQLIESVATSSQHFNLFYKLIQRIKLEFNSFHLRVNWIISLFAQRSIIDSIDDGSTFYFIIFFITLAESNTSNY